MCDDRKRISTGSVGYTLFARHERDVEGSLGPVAETRALFGLNG